MKHAAASRHGVPATQPLIAPSSAGLARTYSESAPTAWRYLGGLGLLLAVVGFSDLLLAVYPFRFGNPDWEFGAIHQAMSILPLPTIGVAGLLGAGFALGKMRLVRVVAVGLLFLGLAVLAMDLVFLTVVPKALEAAPPAVLPGVKRAILRTAVAGTLFPVAYLLTAVAAWRHTRVRRGGR